MTFENFCFGTFDNFNMVCNFNPELELQIELNNERANHTC